MIRLSLAVIHPLGAESFQILFLFLFHHLFAVLFPAQSVRDAAEVTRYRQQLDLERTRALEVSGTDSQDPLRAMLEATQKDKQLAEARLTEVEQELAMVKSQMEDLKGKLNSSTSELKVGQVWMYQIFFYLFV